jgi:hypothetical protein
MTHVSHINNVPVSDEPLLTGWGRLGEIKLTTVKAILFDYHGRELWLAKKNCGVWDGHYYAKTWAIASAKLFADEKADADRKRTKAEDQTPFIAAGCTGKQAFASPTDANKATRRSAVNLISYKCEHCRSWHIGPPKPRKRA